MINATKWLNKVVDFDAAARNREKRLISLSDQCGWTCTAANEARFTGGSWYGRVSPDSIIFNAT